MNAITDPRAVMAAHNNADWYAMMADLHGRAYQRGPAAFVINDPPPYHSHITTLNPNATAAQMDLVQTHHTKPGFGIKDGFDRLDLVPFGLSSGFTAQWIWTDRPANADITGWHRITTPKMLKAWSAAWSETSPNASGQFPNAILDRPDVALFGCVAGAGYSAGGIANLSPDCTGITNFFGDGALAPLALLAHGFGGDRPCVGYARGDILHDAQGAGFIQTGPLRVWFSAV